MPEEENFKPKTTNKASQRQSAPAEQSSPEDSSDQVRAATIVNKNESQTQVHGENTTQSRSEAEASKKVGKIKIRKSCYKI